MVTEMLELMGMMALLMLTGAFLKKKNVITDAGKKNLTDIILYVILPCNIVKAFCVETSTSFWKAFSIMLIVASLVQVLSMIVAKLMYNSMEDGEKQVYQYGTVCSNAGFMGIPLVQSVIGADAVYYAAAFVALLNILQWI